MDSGIYYIKNLVNGKIYIGYSKTINKRLTRHRTHLKYNKHVNNHLQESYNKYGLESFEFNSLEYCKLKDLCRKEDYWVKFFKSNDRMYGYNILDTDENGRPKTLSLEIREKMKGRVVSDRTKDILRERRKIQLLSPESYKKAAETRKKNGYRLPVESAKRRLESYKKTILSRTPEEKERIRLINSECHKGHKISKENMEKLRLAICRPVSKFTLEGIWLEDYKSQTEAAKIVGTKPSYISLVCSGKRRSCGSFIWKFKS